MYNTESQPTDSVHLNGNNSSQKTLILLLMKVSSPSCLNLSSSKCPLCVLGTPVTQHTQLSYQCDYDIVLAGVTML